MNQSRSQVALPEKEGHLRYLQLPCFSSPSSSAPPQSAPPSFLLKAARLVLKLKVRRHDDYSPTLKIRRKSRQK